MNQPRPPQAICPRCNSINIGIQQNCLRCGTPLPPKAIPQPPALPSPAVEPVLPVPPAPSPAAPKPSAVATLRDAAPSVVKLAILDGLLAGKHFLIEELFYIGREPSNELPLPDRKASRRHALIQHKEQAYVITDLNSSNGTYVNEQRITAPTLIQIGDVIVIGDTHLTLTQEA
ncbi:MAG: FHA domain-containing protein [Anaerolineales bacterium]|nr:FHA domain-containing protein [Anaerolineales bacterium]